MAEIVELRPKRPCPICNKPASRENFPFCSPRCHDVDLNRWLSGGYAIPAVEPPDSVDLEEELSRDPDNREL